MKTIRQLREDAGLTQLEVAFRLGVTPATVSNWERGVFEPKASQLRAIARLFEVSSDDIELVESETKKRRPKTAATGLGSPLLDALTR